MQIESSQTDVVSGQDQLICLPQSRVWRAVLAIVALASGSLVFMAWVSPNMVFDLANMVFCG